MIAIKLFFRNETRRAQIYNEESGLTFEILVSTAQNLFPALRGKSNLEFYWNDEDNDTIVVSSDDELLEAARVMSNRLVMRFEIRENEDGELLTSYPVPEPTVAREINMAVHSNVRCDCCDVSPIVGTRYKCAVREDYDLCEQCEGKEAQPHPTIKIYFPDQAPAAIMIASKDDQDVRGPWRGPHHRGHGHHHHHHGHHHHHHHGHHHHHPHDGPHSPGPHNRNPYDHREGSCGPGPQCGPGASWRRMMRQNERRAAEEASKGQEEQGQVQGQGEGGGQNNWIAVAEAFAKSITNEFSEFTQRYGAEEPCDRPSDSSSGSDQDQDQDQVSLEEAVRRSLQDCSLSAVEATVGTLMGTPIVSPVIAESVVSSVSAVSLSKPMARFVRDVTFPDGTHVQPGSVFLKTWRIRNDGTHAWPENVVLTCSGGDALSAADVALPVPSLSAGSEAEATLQLSAPEGTGRHVAYFRMRTSEGVYFGQRLLADIRVVDDDQGWHLVGGMLATSVPSPSEITSPERVEEKDEEEVSQASATAAAVTPPTENAPAPLLEHDMDMDMDMGSSQSSVEAVWTRVWAKELQMLNEMGFTDIAAAVCLLQQHLGIPASLSSAESYVSPEGMQNVISALLAEDGN